MRKVTIFEILVVLSYVLIYKFLLMPLGNLIQYIVNPVIWIIFSLILYIFYLKKEKSRHEQSIIYISTISSIIYVILLYSIGIFIGYSKNPYLININSIIINFFSILLVTGLKEYTRYILQINLKSKVYIIFIFLIFFISDLNLINILKPLNDTTDLLERIITDIVPIISINIFMLYLCNYGGYKPALLYRTILILPTLIIPIFPRLQPSILTLFSIISIFFTYLIIRANINKTERIIRRTNKFSLKFWIFITPTIIILVMFSLGVFPIKGAVIITKSMEPIISPGDMVIIEKCDINSIKEQDIIQYKLNDYTVVHRVIKINLDKNEIITKGDNNNNIDKPINKEQLIGKVRFKIPYIGYPTYIFRKLVGGKNIEVGEG